MEDERRRDSDVAAFLAGDPTTHADLRCYMRAVVACFHFRNSVEEDLVQEAICRVFQSLRTGSFRGEASLRTFGRRVAEIICLEHLRRIRYRGEVDPESIPEPRAVGEPESQLLRAEQHRLNLRRLAAMPQECRELFRMVFIERLSYLEIAKRWGISETAVKLRVYRCRLTARKTRDRERSVGTRSDRKEAST